MRRKGLWLKGCSTRQFPILLFILLGLFCIPAAGQAQMPLRLEALVVSADGNEPSYQGITTFLDYLGVPYRSLIAVNEDLTAEALEDDSGGRYYAVFLASESLAYFDGLVWASAFSTEEWQLLWNYQAKYNVRQVTYYTYPSAQYGLSVPTAVSTESQPYQVHLTTAGKAFFPYLNPDAGIPIRYAYTYLAKPIDEATQVLVQDAEGHAIVSVRTLADGRENLAVTCDNWTYLLHSQLMSYGIISWATRGIHLGERTVYLMPQVDDIFLPNVLFDPAKGAADENKTYRINDKDMKAVEKWQDSLRSRRLFTDFSLVMVYNGLGAEDTTDPLVQYFLSRQSQYQWISHTYTHLNLDAAAYADTLPELQLNDHMAGLLGLTEFVTGNLVTGEVSGLNNPEAMAAAKDFGVRYLVSNTSVPGQNNPSPNEGIYNVHQPSLLQIPRHPTNLFVPASTVEEQVGLYNVLYRQYWGRDLSYQDILDYESDLMLRYMVSYDMDPLMFHQSNLRAYDGEHFLMGDLIDLTVKKYVSYMRLPVLTPTMDKIGDRMAQRMNRKQAGLQAYWVPDRGILLRTSKAAVAALTGVKMGQSAAIDTFEAGTFRNYGGDITSWIAVEPGKDVVVPLSSITSWGESTLAGLSFFGGETEFAKGSGSQGSVFVDGKKFELGGGGTIEGDVVSTGEVKVGGGSVVKGTVVQNAEPYFSIPVIDPEDYRGVADLILDSGGKVRNQAGDLLADAYKKVWMGWKFTGDKWELEVDDDDPRTSDRTVYVEGNVSIKEWEAKDATPDKLTIIATGWIESSEAAHWVANHGHVVFVAGTDIKLKKGGTIQGWIAAHEQVEIADGYKICGSIIAQGAHNENGKVKKNKIDGGGQIECPDVGADGLVLGGIDR